MARKSNRTYYIEIKYSSKEQGYFFGTVMLTEMFQAIRNKESYLFLVCRGRSNNIDEWFFRLFSVEDFIKYCTLTTPIFLYHLDVDAKEHFNLTPPKLTENTVIASEQLIRQMWKDFEKWKSKAYEAEEGEQL